MTQFRNNSEEYSKIKDIVKREVESVLTNPRQILLLTLRSVVESARKESRKFTALVYNFPSPNTLGQSPPTFAGNQYSYVPYMDEQYLSSEYSNNNEETYERILLNEAGQLYNKMVKDLTDKAISNTTSKNESSLQLESELRNVKFGSTSRLEAYRNRSEAEYTFIQSEADDGNRG